MIKMLLARLASLNLGKIYKGRFEIIFVSVNERDMCWKWNVYIFVLYWERKKKKVKIFWSKI